MRISIANGGKKRARSTSTASLEPRPLLCIDCARKVELQLDRAIWICTDWLCHSANRRSSLALSWSFERRSSSYEVKQSESPSPEVICWSAVERAVFSVEFGWRISAMAAAVQAAPASQTVTTTQCQQVCNHDFVFLHGIYQWMNVLRNAVRFIVAACLPDSTRWEEEDSELGRNCCGQRAYEQAELEMYDCEWCCCMLL